LDDDYVRRLDVSVNDTVLVKVGNGVNECPENRLGFVPTQSPTLFDKRL
jgi:hypothetical protein